MKNLSKLILAIINKINHLFKPKYDYCKKGRLTLEKTEEVATDNFLIFHYKCDKCNKIIIYY